MKITVVGGGTAGWLTALFLRQSMPDDQIAVIESEEIGIIGAGEGTTPQIIPALDFLQIPLSDLVRFADATIKHSIQFTNWKGDTTSYFHSFQPRVDLQFLPDPWSPATFVNADTDDSYMYQKKYDDPYEAMNIAALLAAMNRSPFFERPCDLRSVRSHIELFDKVCNYAVHFNAVKLADLLKSIATHRGVVHIEGKVQDIHSEANGDITHFTLDDKRVIETDFVFDCSGFQRLIIGKHFKSKWVSFKDFLPTDRAVAYFKPSFRPTPAYTQSIAMKNGWSWQIPLQTRYGAGYVFSSSFTDEDKAREEIVALEGDNASNIEWGKTFKFEPGYYEDVWVNNCIAVGLSTGFLEPLEATSIMQTIRHLELITSLKLNLLEVPKREKKKISLMNAELTSEIADFLYLHYFSDRNDTEFWRQFSYGAKNMPAFIENILDICRYRMPVKEDFKSKIAFTAYNYCAIIDGNSIISKQLYDTFFQTRRNDRTEEYLSMRRNIGIEARRCLDHDAFLSQLR